MCDFETAKIIKIIDKLNQNEQINKKTTTPYPDHYTLYSVPCPLAKVYITNLNPIPWMLRIWILGSLLKYLRSLVI